mmetsp:Transcript_31316/g.60503  ORF Transcript_31316/g.60503 Transcript_31316/m.60503 type:complete len:162 (-) Transcript_31316:42-527(-)
MRRKRKRKRKKVMNQNLRRLTKAASEEDEEEKQMETKENGESKREEVDEEKEKGHKTKEKVSGIEQSGGSCADAAKAEVGRRPGHAGASAFHMRCAGSSQVATRGSFTHMRSRFATTPSSEPWPDSSLAAFAPSDGGSAKSTWEVPLVSQITGANLEQLDA